jgi:uncharacterized protein YjbI with pentapeptide repeats
MASQEIDQAVNKDLELSSTIKTSQREVLVFKPKSNFWSELSKQLPVLLTIVGLVWGIYQFNAQQVGNAAQTLDQQRQNTFDTYLDRMSDLLLNDNLLTSQPNSPVRAIAEARTLTALRDLDGNRRAQLVRFLWKAGLDTGDNPVVSLNAAPLNSTLFQHALLMSINLSGALLINSTFDDCDLTGANFTKAELPGATLTNVNLSGAIMIGANLYGARLEDATLNDVNLARASLQHANLSGDDLRQVNLAAANLAGANLKGALITPDQLKQIASLHGTILPDGSTHS